MTLDTTPAQRNRVDLRETLQAAPLGAYHFRLALMLALILWYDGFDLYNASYIVHDVTPAWHLSPSQIGLLLSCGLGGFAIGSAVSGLFGDRFGRRRVILPGVWVSSAMSLAIALFAHDLSSFVMLTFHHGPRARAADADVRDLYQRDRAEAFE
ncbi:MFS transporter [Caballeronia sp. LZ065]|nr:MFS transporter [Caballeronia sp. LZ065]